MRNHDIDMERWEAGKGDRLMAKSIKHMEEKCDALRKLRDKQVTGSRKWESFDTELEIVKEIFTELKRMKGEKE